MPSSTERSEEVQAKLSASKLEAASLCPAFFKANIRFPWTGERDAADEGTIRHDNEEKEIPLDDIEDNERRRCAYNCRKAISACRETIGIGESQVVREARYWYGTLWSGQLDYEERFGEAVFIADYKTLHGSHTPAPDNVQLLAQAVLVSHNHPEIETVYAALIEPFQNPTYTTVQYSKEHLLKKAEWLKEVVERSYVEDGEQIPGGKQCKWCSGLPFCGAARKHIFSCIQKAKL
jgi:hypothetical protein